MTVQCRSSAACRRDRCTMCSGHVLATTSRWWQGSCQPRPRSSARAANRCLTWAAVLTTLCAGALRSERTPPCRPPAWQPCHCPAESAQISVNLIDRQAVVLQAAQTALVACSHRIRIHDAFPARACSSHVAFVHLARSAKQRMHTLCLQSSAREAARKCREDFSRSLVLAICQAMWCSLTARVMGAASRWAPSGHPRALLM